MSTCRLTICLGMAASALLLGFASDSFAMQSSQGPLGVNLDLASSIGIGAGVKVGILDVTQFGLLPDNYLGTRLQDQWNFRDIAVGDIPLVITEGVDPHETLVAHIIGSGNSTYRGTAPGSEIYVAAISDDFASFQAGTAWLSVTAGTAIMNLSGGWGYNENGQSDRERYIDWLSQTHDLLMVKTSGNNGGQINDPGGLYNGITVGMYNEATQGRDYLSSYQLTGGNSEARGKPEILAPGVGITDGVSYGNVPQLGTSFASPHVAGTAAVLIDIGEEQLGGAPLGHLAAKALVLNGARKRAAAGPQPGLAQSYDFTPNHFSRDRNYLTAGDTGFAPGDTGLTTSAWTPTAWSHDGTTFSSTRPLDEEQGVGILDTSRSVINILGGRQTPGGVTGIGWDIGTISPAGLVTYSLAQAIPAGNFLTATLVWDRIVSEADSDGIIELADVYAHQELANLDLRLRDGNGTILAQSISTTDNLEHLHVPLTTFGSPGDYSLEVVYNGGGVLPTDYAVAWWVGNEGLEVGDYNSDGVVDGTDYFSWQSSLGRLPISRTGLAAGDGNGDSLIDIRDFTVWRDHISGGMGNATSVPEPAPISLALAAIASLAVPFRGYGPKNLEEIS